MEQDADWRVAEAMIRHGGGFIQKLGEAFRHADADNRLKLRNAFPEYFERYQVIGARIVPDDLT